jgi:hypothetical protein
MKNNFLAILSLIVAITMSSYTKPIKRSLTSHVFLYNIASAGSYGATQVADVNNWDLYEGTNPCEGDGEEIPCSIEVPYDPDYINGTHPSNNLQIEVSSSGSVRFVIDVKDIRTLVSVVISIINKLFH